MEITGIIGSIASVVAAFFSFASYNNSKKSVLGKIDRKERKIQKINNELIRRYGLNRRSGGGITPLDMKRNKLQKEVDELKRLL